jgi:sulfopyruvate decarboxylase alpha subunit
MDEIAKPSGKAGATQPWSLKIYNVFKEFHVRRVAYVPDSGHSELIRRAEGDQEMRALALTSEEEGVALLSGAWLGGERGALLMQSSGVGNCVNMLSLVKLCRIPFLTLVTMRGEWGEFNPWQAPMGAAAQRALELMDVHVLRASRLDEIEETVRAGAAMAFEGGAPVAVLLSQRVIGAKKFAGQETR